MLRWALASGAHHGGTRSSSAVSEAWAYGYSFIETKRRSGLFGHEHSTSALLGHQPVGVATGLWPATEATEQASCLHVHFT